MDRFEPVEIEQQGGHYRLTQGGELRLSVPATIFARYTADTVFPPQWDPVEHSHPVRRLHWNPDTLEFLMAGLESHPSRTTEAYGGSTYRSFLHGFWIPTPPLLLLRPYWSPSEPSAPFDRRARARNFEVQQAFVHILTGLRPPPGWGVILNVTEAYLQAIGMDTHGTAPEPDAVREVSLTPPRPLAEPRVAGFLRQVALEHTGNLFPFIRQEQLVAVHSLCLPTTLTVQGLLDRLGIENQQGPYRPH